MPKASHSTEEGVTPMNTRRIVQLSALLITCSLLTGMFAFTPVYDEVLDRIVSILCLSCIKLQPKTSQDFTFVTGNNESHPDFVLENLSTGPVFLHYSGDVCLACDHMLPIIQEFFNVSFNKSDFFTAQVIIQNTTVNYIYINIDHAPEEEKESIDIYDKEHIPGIPMFSFVTLGYDHGTVRPYYTTIYGEHPREIIESLSSDMINLYKQNKEGYSHH